MSAPPPESASIEQKLDQLPKSPGAYLFLDGKGKVIYVGKAKSLRSRVKSYFTQPDDGRTYYPFLVAEVRDVQWVVATNDTEAILLENNLIKRHKPRFNVKLVDDKTYLSIKITTNEPWPRALFVRRVKRDGALYFGPYGSARAIRETLRTIRKFFPLRTCSNAEFRNRTRPCIQHQIGRCGAPCVALQDERGYAEGVEEAVLFLKGRTRELRERLWAQMQAESEALRFESAARLRDQIRSIERSAERQHAVSHDKQDRDVFGVHRAGDTLRVQALFFRDGRLVSSHLFPVRARLGADEALRSFFTQFYGAERTLPDEVLYPVELEDGEALEAWLSERRGRRVRILWPRRGRKRELVELARRNAEEAYHEEAERAAALRRTLEDLQARLGLARLPRRIECMDVSGTGQDSVVASVVALEDGEPDKARYLRFKVRDPERRGDTERMEEVITRRLQKGLKRRGDLPDLLVLDGGPLQLAVGVRVREALGLEGTLDLAAIAKSREDGGRVIRRAGAVEAERIFVPGREAPVAFPGGAASMHLLQRLRDEAHRFAITYHRSARRKRSFRSVLDEIPGVGPKRKKALLEQFGSLKALAAASVADIALCPTITPAQAERIHEHLKDIG